MEGTNKLSREEIVAMLVGGIGSVALASMYYELKALLANRVK